MQNYRSILITATFISLSLAACGKPKKIQLSGQESEGQAMEYCLKLSQKKRFQEAVDCLEIVKSRYPGSVAALDAELKIADNYFNQKQWLLAAESYLLYAKLRPESEKLDYAYYRAGLAYAKLLPKSIDRDQAVLEKGRQNLAVVFRSYPSSPYSALAQEKYDLLMNQAARRNLYIAKFYFKYGEYRAAIPRFMSILQDYPGSGQEETALYHLGVAYHRLGMEEQAKATLSLMQEKLAQSSRTRALERKLK